MQTQTLISNIDPVGTANTANLHVDRYHMTNKIQHALISHYKVIIMANILNQ